MEFVKLNEEATLPVRATKLSAGYDLKSIEDVHLVSGQRKLISTGIGWIDVVPSVVGLIRPKSGLAYKCGIDVMAGVIDADYRDEIKVLLINHSENVFVIDKGDSIAQLLIQQWFTVAEEDIIEARDGGFGSTDKGNGKLSIDKPRSDEVVLDS